MGAAVARLGDGSTHGGSIISASSNLKANGTAVARTGDMHACPIPGHGVTPLTSSTTTKNGGKSLIRVGDTAGCGAAINAGSSNVNAG